jgi:hypothetical protein
MNEDSAKFLGTFRQLTPRDQALMANLVFAFGALRKTGQTAALDLAIRAFVTRLQEDWMR